MLAFINANQDSIIHLYSIVYQRLVMCLIVGTIGSLNGGVLGTWDSVQCDVSYDMYFLSVKGQFRVPIVGLWAATTPRTCRALDSTLGP